MEISEESRRLRGLMASMMPSATAWRARSWLVQWVMCSPPVIGSRQASSTIWARWRGGDLLRTAQAGFVQQESCQAALLVAATDAPDGGPVTLHPRATAWMGSPPATARTMRACWTWNQGRCRAPSDGLEDRKIRGSDGQGARFSATHGTTSGAAAGLSLQHTARPQFLALLRANPTRINN